MKYSTDEQKIIERQIGNFVAKKYACEYFENPNVFGVVDGLFTRHKKIHCLIEIKNRDVSFEKFPWYMIDKAKADKAWDAAKKLDVGLTLIYQFVDGVFCFSFPMDKDPSRHYDSEISGRTVDTRDENDIDEVYKLPKGDWKKL